MIRLIAGREIRERLRTKSFYLLSGLLVVIILAGGVVSRFVSDDGIETVRVGVTEPVPEGFGVTVDLSAEGLGRDLDVTPIDGSDAARAALEDGDVDVIVLGVERQIVFADDIDDRTQAVIQLAWSGAAIYQALLDAGLSPEQVVAALSPTPLATTTLDGDTESDGLAVLTGTMAAILLFISLQTFGGYVLMGVVEEKSTAVVEVLLARARADQLLAGKVIGIGVAALTQFAMAVAAGVVSLAVSGTSVPAAVWAAVPMTLVWFLGGYAFYSTLYALAGSLVSRQEDAQAASAPILSALMAGYLIVFVVGYVPEGGPATILSLLPPIAPLLMPMRMAAGAASLIEVTASLVLLAAATVGAWKLAGRIYDQVLLRRGSRISWREALATLRPSGGSSSGS